MDEQLQDALQKRVTESFKAVNQQLEQVYKGLGEMQSLAADVGGLKQVLSGIFPVYVVDFNRQIKYFSSFVYLGNDFSGKSHIDKFRELG